MSTSSNMPSNARVWVYAANEPFTNDVLEQIKTEADIFVANWTAHENPLKATVDVLYNTFLIFMLDESYNAVSGCGIDKSVQFVKQMEQKHALIFFDRLKVQVLFDDESVKSLSKIELQKLLDEGKINENTIAFNNIIQNKNEFDQNWKIPLKDSWAYKSLKSTQNSI